MDAILAYLKARERDMKALIKRLVECETPSGDAAAIARFVGLVANEVRGVARVKKIPGGRWGPHLRCEFAWGNRGQTTLSQASFARGQSRLSPVCPPQILALGHSDTVHPIGALNFREAEGRLWGPGVLDMKAGIALFLFAMCAVRELGLPLPRPLVLLLNSDEEVGSPSSRPVTEEEARRSEAVLVLEPGTGLEGKLKTARKGVGDYTLAVRGRAAHAGLDFTEGASAVLELARQIERVAAFTDLKRGITVNPGVVAGGTRTNVVAGEARAEIDVRVVRLRDAAALDKKFRRLRPVDRRCTLEISGGLNRPPMERSAGVVKLYRGAQAAARELGVEIEESLSGGGSDGNFTAALGVPTLDGVGAVGEGAHAAHESVLIGRLADRAALIAKLVTA